MTFRIAKFRGLLVAASLAMLVEFLMGLSDSVVAGNILGETALAGINLLQPPMNLISFVAALFGTGTAICYSLEIGRCDRSRAADMFSQGLLAAALAGGILAGTMVVGRDAFLDAFGAAPEVRALAQAYWNWFVPCAFLEPVVFLLTNACYADGDSRLCIAASAAQFLGNCGMSVLLTLTPMGISGCALGTVLGHLGALAVLSFHFRKRSNTLRFVRHFSWGDLVHIGRVSFGDASVRLCWAILFCLLNKYVIDRFGSGMLPVLGVVLAVLGLSEAFNGVPNAAQPLVGVYMGERNVSGVLDVMRAATRTMLAASAGLLALLVVFPQLAVRLIGIDDPTLVGPACTAVRWVSAGLVATGICSLFNSYYAFIEHEGLSSALTILANLAIPLALYPLFGSLWGAVGVWLALGAAPVATCAVFAVFLLLRHGRASFPWLLDRGRTAKIHMFDLELTEEQICRTSVAAADALRAAGAPKRTVGGVSLLIEEVLMAVKDRNGARKVLAEATLDLNEGVSLVLRDDGEIFDITDADARISSLRSYLVCSIMEGQKNRMNLTTTGYNRNVFRFAAAAE